MEGINREENYDPKKRFEEYLKENKGKPIDPCAVETGKKELKLGAKSGYAVVKDEPGREKLIASYPKGRAQEEEFSESEETILDPEKVVEETKRKHKEEILNQKDFEVAIRDLSRLKSFLLNLAAVGERTRKKNSGTTSAIIRILSIYYDIRGPINELPEQINDLIEEYQAKLAGS